MNRFGRDLLIICLFCSHLGSIPPGFVGNGAWMNPTQYFYCACCPPLGGGVTQPSPIVSGGTPYNQVALVFLEVYFDGFGPKTLGCVLALVCALCVF